MNASRRRFLEDSMFAAAAMVAAPALTFAAEDAKQSKSPNEKLAVACIGVKGRGGSHIDAFAGRKDTEITYICDVDQKIGMNQVENVGKRQGRTPKFVED